ncbi:MAG: hypothetical protein DMD30_12615 [Gemmatimonadetes bacterium]|nr:MAG: hypothetical protein DMD30_12615 [Gemmatimonadota bacterium]
MNAYGWLKFLHALSVIVWLGGIAGLAVVTWRVAREGNRAVVAAVVRHATFFGQWIVGPASGLVLLSGLAMVGMARIGFATFWVLWGYGGIVVHGVTGGVFLRKRIAELAQIASEQSGNDVALVTAGRRLWTRQLVYLLLLATVVAAMIFKPTL